VERLGEPDRGAAGVGSAAAKPAPAAHRRLLFPSSLALSQSTPTPNSPLLFTGQTGGCWLGAPELQPSERGCSIGWEAAASARPMATPTGGRCRGGLGSAVGLREKDAAE